MIRFAALTTFAAIFFLAASSHAADVPLALLPTVDVSADECEAKSKEAEPATAAAAAEQAHAEIWRRFMDRHGVMIDFAAMDGSLSLPTPEECRDGKPNALGWWSPIAR